MNAAIVERFSPVDMTLGEIEAPDSTLGRPSSPEAKLRTAQIAARKRVEAEDPEHDTDPAPNHRLGRTAQPRTRSRRRRGPKATGRKRANSKD